MAKNTQKSGGTARVRLIVLEAELPDGDVSQLAAALQNAIRSPAPPVIKRLTSTTTPQVNGGSEQPAEEVYEEDQGEVDAVDVTPVSPKPKTPRKAAPKPTVIDIDITSEPPLSSLSDPKSNHKRYLAIAAWLHDHRKIEAVTADHIYTCYRHLGWPTDILDFAQPLRELKHKQFFTTPERGKYAINQLGLAKAAEAGE